MSFREAAYLILKREKRPLSAKEITEIALRERLIKTKGKTPEATMGAIIYKDIRKRREQSPFVKVGKGLFGLREFEKDKEKKGEKAKETVLEADDIIKKLREAQFRSNSPTDFEKAIKNAFEFLGFEAELIGTPGDTDVLLTANIGDESFKVTVDGKTSKSGKIIDRQIDWLSLRDHKDKNEADFIVVVGPDFSGGNLEKRANENDVALLKTEGLIKLVEEHSQFPFTLKELKDLFIGKSDISAHIDDLVAQSSARRNLLEHFRVILEEMQAIQDHLGYFTRESLAARKKLEELQIDPKDINYIINLLNLPFINGIEELSENKYILTIGIKDIANIFRQLSNSLISPKGEGERASPPDTEIGIKDFQEKRFGSKYFDWEIRGNSVVAFARKENPYEHYCPIEHFITIIRKIEEAFKSHNVVNTDLIFSMLKGKELAPNRPFKGKPEKYKIRMALGILEREGLIKWTGSKRPIEYTLKASIHDIEEWLIKKF